MHKRFLLLPSLVLLNLSVFAMEGGELLDAINDPNPAFMQEKAQRAKDYLLNAKNIVQGATNDIAINNASEAKQPEVAPAPTPALTETAKNQTTEIVVTEAKLGNPEPFTGKVENKANAEKKAAVSWLSKEVAMRLGIGAGLVIVIGTATYILHKKGILQVIGNKIVKHPYISAATLSSLALITAGIYYYAHSTSVVPAAPATTTTPAVPAAPQPK